ncbi:unnamed protein product [Alopecurus aequalis]
MPPTDMAWFVGWMNRVTASLTRRKLDAGDPTWRPLIENDQAVAAMPERVLCENSLMLQLFALGAALTLLPYMGPDGLLKEPKFSPTYRLWVSRVFPVWWIIVCMGVPCSIWGRWWIEVQFARVTTHLGMLGISVLVILFSDWLLAIEIGMLWILLIISTSFSFGFWIRCCCVEDL